MIEVKCSSCGKSFEVPDSLRGKSEICPRCGLDIPVPEAVKPEPVLLDNAVSKNLDYRSVAAPNLHKSRVERATVTESAMAVFGALFFVAGLICTAIGFVLLSSDEYGSSGGFVLIISGLGVAVMGLPYWAVHHVLRYLRRLVNK